VNLLFVYQPEFVRQTTGWLGDEDLRRIELELLANPQAGAVIPGTGGVRKLRVALPGQGKRGAARVVYLYVAVAYRVYVLTAYRKSRQADVSATGRQALYRLAQALKAIHDQED
jgi:hypothetical protein